LGLGPIDGISVFTDGRFAVGAAGRLTVFPGFGTDPSWRSLPYGWDFGRRSVLIPGRIAPVASAGSYSVSTFW
jgi:hypothetical protein